MARKRTTHGDEDRVRAAFGLRSRDEPIPPVGLESLRRYHRHLVSHLAFPFSGRLSSPVGPHRDTEAPLSVVRLMDPVKEYAPEEMYGLICKAIQDEERIELPLDRIDVPENSPNRQLLEDYRWWLRNRG
jgi:hypothetical protein